MSVVPGFLIKIAIFQGKKPVYFIRMPLAGASDSLRYGNEMAGKTPLFLIPHWIDKYPMGDYSL